VPGTLEGPFAPPLPQTHWQLVHGAPPSTYQDGCVRRKQEAAANRPSSRSHCSGSLVSSGRRGTETLDAGSRRHGGCLFGPRVRFEPVAAITSCKNYRWSCDAQVRRCDLRVVEVSGGDPGNRNDPIHYRGPPIEALCRQHGRGAGPGKAQGLAHPARSSPTRSLPFADSGGSGIPTACGSSCEKNCGTALEAVVTSASQNHRGVTSADLEELSAASKHQGVTRSAITSPGQMGSQS